MLESSFGLVPLKCGTSVIVGVEGEWVIWVELHCPGAGYDGPSLHFLGLAFGTILPVILAGVTLLPKEVLDEPVDLAIIQKYDIPPMETKLPKIILIVVPSVIWQLHGESNALKLAPCGSGVWIIKDSFVVVRLHQALVREEIMQRLHALIYNQLAFQDIVQLLLDPRIAAIKLLHHSSELFEFDNSLGHMVFLIKQNLKLSN